jgi:hypothetical protein
MSAGSSAVMKFKIEIAHIDGAISKVIYSATVDEMSPRRAMMKATSLRELYSGRGANSVRVLNDKNEELYRL